MLFADKKVVRWLAVCGALARVRRRRPRRNREEAGQGQGQGRRPASLRWWRPTATGACSRASAASRASATRSPQPKARDPDDLKRDPAYAFISERPAERVRNEVSFIMGFEVGAATADEPKDEGQGREGQEEGGQGRREAEVGVAPTAAIGDAEFELLPKGSDLWVKNAAQESQLIDEMRKGAQAQDQGRLEEGQRHRRHLFAVRLQPGDRPRAEGLPGRLRAGQGESARKASSKA